MRLGLADLAQPLVPHLAAGRRVACGRGGHELLASLGRGANFPLVLAVCLGLGDADHQRLDPGEPERLGAADLDPQGPGGLALRAVDGESDLRITQGVLGPMQRTVVAWEALNAAAVAEVTAGRGGAVSAGRGSPARGPAPP